ncbi:transcription factor HES-1-B-like [Euwallacea similis]|uniref:transcription factor HES-1-B-like n=1 Tax=Euwallacea similis TaxID=1736056 RepID=UPI00344FDA13
MSMSDDEFEPSSRMQEPQSGTMSKAELRKSHKPIMEKRRRARINHCLNEIKNLILEALNKDPARHTKLEKADILEMAVKHLQNVQKQQLAIGMATDPSAIRKFKNGFKDCVSEIDRFISKSDNTEGGMRDRVTNHLQNYINRIDQAAQPIPFVSTSIFTSNSSGEGPSGIGDQNNNPRIQVPQGIHLIPSRLPTGELALLVPNSSNLRYFPSSHRQSAFALVHQAQSSEAPRLLTSEPPRLLSPPLSPESTKGFRPIAISRPAEYPDDHHQVAQVSSTVAFADKSKMEVKTMKFPIHNKPLERKVVEHTSVIKTLSEPLCVITNHGERYKQAQHKEDSLFLEENQTESRGVKRDYSEMLHYQGLLAPMGEGVARPSKIIKTSHHEAPSSSYAGMGEPSKGDGCVVLGKAPKEADEQQNKGDQGDMWRPW